MRIIFAGTPEFAAAHLKALIDHPRHDVVAVYSQPDRRAGRGKKLLASAVKQLAQQANIAIEQPISLKDDAALQALANYQADLMVVAAYGLLLPQAVLDTPRLGCINIHASLLPRWRGAAPIERAILAGDEATGITIMQMEAGLDTGDMWLKKACAIKPDETGDSLRQKLIELGKPLLLEALELIERGDAIAEPQNDADSNYASKLVKQEACIDWRESAIDIDRRIRAFTSAMPTFTYLDSQRIRLTAATPIDSHTGHAKDTEPGSIIGIDKNAIAVQCGQQVLAVTELQMPGAKSMAVQALLNGRPDAFRLGQCFMQHADASS